MRHAVLLVLLSAAWVSAQDEEEKFQSGPKAGAVLPGPFDAYNVSGKKGKGRQHCLVCEFGLNPVVQVFAHEPAEGKDGPLNTLLAKLDEAVSRFEDQYLGSYAVFLSADAKNSANSTEEDSGKLVQESTAREELIKRLEGRADKLKNVVLAIHPIEGPKGYGINPKAEHTIVFYYKHKVLANYAYPAGKMTEDDVEKVLKNVEDTLAKLKKKPVDKKKK